MQKNTDFKKFFQELKEYEKQARDFYANLSKKLSDKPVKKVLDSIKEDEIRHMKTAQELVDLTSNKKISGSTKTSSDFSLDLNSNSTFLLVTSTANYIQKNADLINFLSSKKKKVVCFSLNKTKQDLAKAMKKLGVNPKGIKVLDCFSNKLDPKNLTSLQMSLLNSTKNSSDLIVVFDSVSFLSIYHSTNTLREFARALISLSKKHNFKLILIIIEEESDKLLISSLSSMVDQTIK